MFLLLFLCFKQDGAIFTLSSNSLKLVDQFTYLGSYISLTKSDVNIHIGKVWIAIDKLSIIWKSDFIDKIKWGKFSKLCQSYCIVVPSGL